MKIADLMGSGLKNILGLSTLRMIRNIVFHVLFLKIIFQGKLCSLLLGLIIGEGSVGLNVSLRSI